MLTVHRYALSACARPGSRLYPTITRLLRASASVGLADTLARSVALARARRLPIRWDELNSVTCSGTLGVSDAFASALWATDTLFAALAVGVNGVNVQMRASALNAPFYVTRSAVVTRPLLYGLLLFDRALGRNARRVATAVSQPASANVSAWAVRVAGGRLNTVLLNKGAAAQIVVLRAPRGGTATIARLLSSSIRTRSAVTLAGRPVDRPRRPLARAAPYRVRPLVGRRLPPDVAGVQRRAGERRPLTRAGDTPARSHRRERTSTTALKGWEPWDRPGCRAHGGDRRPAPALHWDLAALGEVDATARSRGEANVQIEAAPRSR
jgi:hypothetical protein